MELLIYFGQVSLYACFLWGVFRLFWRDRPFLNQARIFLLLSLLLPAFLPFIRLPRPAAMSTVVFQEVLPAIQLKAASASGHSMSFSLPEVLIYLYFAVGLIQLMICGLGYLQVSRKLKNGSAQNFPEFKLITNCQLGPGTLGRRIFFPLNEVDTVILEHERTHIRLGHQFDLWLLQAMRILFWFSPAHWLLAAELKAIHEFQADEEARKSTQTAEYMNLLLSQALGTARLLPIAHFFSPQLLKRRIMMLQNRNSNGKRSLIFLTVLFSAGFLSTILFAQTKQSANAVAANGSTSTKSAYPDVPPQNLRPNYGEVNIQSGAITFKIVEKRPEFKGNLFEFLQKNLRTENLNLDDKTPACIIQFVVAASGEIQNPQVQQSSGIEAWDAEVMRVVRLMPSWKPGMQKGSPVAVSVSLPVYHNGGGC